MKRTEIRRLTPLAPGTGPARVPLARSKGPSRTRGPKRGRRAKADQGLPPAFWEGRRESLYARAGGLCEMRGCSLDHQGLEAHHRRLRSQGRDHGLHNLAALCPACHRWVHANPAAARSRGFIVRSTQDPAAMPVRLHDHRVVLLTADGGYTPTTEECL